MCEIEAPKDANEAKAMKICGILNICPFPGLSAAVYGCIVGEGYITCIGVCQYIACFFLVGWIWAIIYGVAMMSKASSWEEKNRSTVNAVAPVAPVAPVPPKYAPPPSQEAQRASDEIV